MQKVQVFAWCTLAAMFGFSAAQFSPALISRREESAPRTRCSSDIPMAPPSPAESSDRPARPAAEAVARALSVSASSAPSAKSSGLPERPTTQAPPRNSGLGSFRFAGIGPNGGVRLGRVTPGTLPDLLGLKTGDEIITLNGFRIAEPQQALQAYARLPYVDAWIAAIQRDGVQKELRYALR
jgi:hypothetical protein